MVIMVKQQIIAILLTLRKKKLAKEFFKLYFINSVYSPKVLHFVKEISVIDGLPHKFCGTYIYCD